MYLTVHKIPEPPDPLLKVLISNWPANISLPIHPHCSAVTKSLIGWPAHNMAAKALTPQSPIISVRLDQNTSPNWLWRQSSQTTPLRPCAHPYGEAVSHKDWLHRRVMASNATPRHVQNVFFKLKPFYCKMQREGFVSCVCISIRDSTLNWGGHVQGWCQNTAQKHKHTQVQTYTHRYTHTHRVHTFMAHRTKCFCVPSPTSRLLPSIRVLMTDRRDGGRARTTENILPFSVHIFTCSLILLSDNTSSPYCQLEQGFKLENVFYLILVHNLPVTIRISNHLYHFLLQYATQG